MNDSTTTDDPTTARRSDGHDAGTRLWIAGDPEPDRTAVWDDCAYAWLALGDGRWMRQIPARIFGVIPRRPVRTWAQLLNTRGPVADQPRRP